MTDAERRELEDLRRRKQLALASMRLSSERRVTELVAIAAVCGRIVGGLGTPPPQAPQEG